MAEDVIAKSRREEMASMYRSGATMQEIADALGISRQRVQVLLAKAGVNRADGQADKRMRLRAYGIESASELAGYQASFPGCLDKYRQQKRNAEARGVKWGFTLRTWLSAWGDQWEKRGIGGESLVMCRKGDVGPYAPGNIYIATCGQNAYDYQVENRHRKRQ